jgi:hypothetical protein
LLQAQIDRIDQAALGQHHRAADAVDQLAHIARPVVRHHGLQRAPAEALEPAAALGRELAEVVLREQADVVAALTQRRHRQRQHVEPVVQVLAEGARGHGGLEIDVGGRDHAHIDLDRARAADAIDGAFLQEAQQVGLHVQRQVADLVEEQRAVVRAFDQAAPLPVGTGERALLVTEQLGLDQRGRNRAAIDDHEGRFGARRCTVDGLRHQLLAGAAFAVDQRRCVDLGHALDLAQQPRDGGGLTDDALAASSWVDAGHAGAQARVTVSVAQRGRQARRVDRHRDVVEHALEDQVAAFLQLQR